MQAADERAVIVRPHKQSNPFAGRLARQSPAPNPPGQLTRVDPVKPLAGSQLVPRQAVVVVWAGLGGCSAGLAAQAAPADQAVQGGLAGLVV